MERNKRKKLQIQDVAGFCKFNWLQHVETHVGMLGLIQQEFGENI